MAQVSVRPLQHVFCRIGCTIIHTTTRSDSIVGIVVFLSPKISMKFRWSHFRLGRKYTWSRCNLLFLINISPTVENGRRYRHAIVTVVGEQELVDCISFCCNRYWQWPASSILLAMTNLYNKFDVLASSVPNIRTLEFKNRSHALINPSWRWFVVHRQVLYLIWSNNLLSFKIITDPIMCHYIITFKRHLNRIYWFLPSSFVLLQPTSLYLWAYMKLHVCYCYKCKKNGRFITTCKAHKWHK